METAYEWYEPTSALTPRQIEVIALAAREGLTIKGLAARLCPTERGVRFHMELAYRSLGVQTMGQAIYKAMKLGLLK